MSIARSASRSALFAMGAISIALAMPVPSSAGVLITVTEIGSNLKVDYSGGFTGIVGAGTSKSVDTYVGVDDNGFWAQANTGYTEIASAAALAPSGTDYFPGLTGWIEADSADGGSQPLILESTFIGVPSLSSGSFSTSGGFTFLNTSFADWGLTAGESNEWTWTQSGQSFVSGNTVTITAVPEPQVLALAGTVGVAIASGFRRKKWIAARS